MKLLAVAFVALLIAVPTALAAPDDPCICDPSPCGPAPSVVADPGAYADWFVCNALGGHPW